MCSRFLHLIAAQKGIEDDKFVAAVVKRRASRPKRRSRRRPFWAAGSARQLEVARALKIHISPAKDNCTHAGARSFLRERRFFVSSMASMRRRFWMSVRSTAASKSLDAPRMPGLRPT